MSRKGPQLVRPRTTPPRERIRVPAVRAILLGMGVRWGVEGEGRERTGEGEGESERDWEWVGEGGGTL